MPLTVWDIHPDGSATVTERILDESDLAEAADRARASIDAKHPTVRAINAGRVRWDGDILIPA